MQVQSSSGCQFVILFGFSGKIAYVKTTYLYGNLEEEIHIECPQGMSKVVNNDYAILNKCIYGFVQAARQCYKRLTRSWRNQDLLGAMLTHVFVKKRERGIIHVAFYVDDSLMMGDVEATDKVITALKENGLVLKIMEVLQD